MDCKHCGSREYVRDGIVGGKQRYQCKQCKRTFREGDKREKYTNEKRMRVLKWYLEGVGIMSIERIEDVPNPLIIKWIRKFAKILREKFNEVVIPNQIQNIEIVELDELFSYCKKNLTKSTYGLLLIGNDLKLLISKSAPPEALKPIKA